jgi:hypothetical protein
MDQVKEAEGRMTEDLRHNRVGGLQQIEKYRDSNINLAGWEITSVLDDVLLVQYADTSANGEDVQRGGIILPTDMTKNVWRIGKVILAGPNATIKPGEFIMFPNDKGIQAKNINGLKNAIFLNEERIFGVVKPTSS